MAIVGSAHLRAHANTLINACTAANTGGGGLFVGTTAIANLDAAPQITANVAAGNGLGGGILADAGSTLSVTSAIFANNVASSGGGIAVVDPQLVAETLRATASVDVPMARGAAAASAGPTAIPSIELVDVALTDNSASLFGDAVFACGASIAMRGAAASWRSSSKHAFVCAADGFAPSLASSVGLPWLRIAPDAWSALVETGAGKIAGPLATLEWASLPRTSVPSGEAIEGAIRGRDMFGQSLIEPHVTLVLSYDTPQSSALVGGVATTPLVTTAVASPTAAVYVTAGAETNIPLAVDVALGVDARLAASGATVGMPVSPLRASMTVGGCAAGEGGVARTIDGVDVIACALCPSGTTSPGDGSLASCTGTLSCPENTFRTPSNASTDGSGSVCVCKSGFWSPSMTVDTACELCPRGGVCAGELEPPVAAPGFFPDAAGSTLFVACPNERACAGDGTCSSGYTARLCAECDRGYYRLGSVCHKCNGGRNALVITLLVLGILAVCWMLLGFNLAESMRYKFAAAMIGLNGLQISALYGKLDLDWGDFAQLYFDLASALNVDLGLTAPECAVVTNADVWVLKWVLTLALPLLAAIIVGIGACAIVVGRQAGLGLLAAINGRRLVGAYGRTVFQILVLLYLPLARASFAVFGCRRDESRRWVMDADPARSCYNSAWWRGLFAPGLLAVAGYGIGVPAAVVAVLWQKRRHLDPVAFQLQYGFLVGRFTGNTWWFEAAIMARKAGVVIAMTFVFADEGKANTALVILVAALVHLALARPYAAGFHNAVAGIVLAATSLVLYGGTFDERESRRIAVAVGIIVNVLAIVLGNAIDILRMVRNEKAVEADEFYVSGVFANADGFDDAADLDPATQSRMGDGESPLLRLPLSTP
ncbi:uncharacterized protein AMSG_03398 [Thecamonas trahens ATCC 50062]|uniref:DUF7630 domain-containing protein n=1 Tax=Thecamonas trahens ATCC 50062 TaxID=461836 RepID=A0A0L0D3Z4_THETB|nr:hypothetical protein AMSG_03398 [Thecamonas trahens ATCC 50062]KNC46965.1 hypothetical protein AMSG_03398 [Thecamonas trahens ATCC 50062]|eukprot:XP_013760236.1 hypothetical protein AMSG_03398 [Thecamonas trahens ATCC 50062]